MNRIGSSTPRRAVVAGGPTPLPAATPPRAPIDQLAIAPGRKPRTPVTAAPKATPAHVGELDATIQATLARGDAYRTTLAELVEKNLGPSATAVGKRLARKWIDNAAHHVFTDPHRWVVELAANAIDASRGTKVSAGQFGMGFLSCLEFLGHAETQGSRIAIETFTHDRAYRVSLSGKAADPDVCIEALPKRATTGTTIRITPNVGQFSSATTQGIARQLALLQFNPHAGLAATTVTPREISIADSGPGMSTLVIASKLLMPSGSTKTRAAADLDAPVVAPELVTWAGKRSAELSYALVEIAGVVVVANEISPPVRDAQGKVTDVLMRMPHWTRVTLDRDEVILDSHGGSAEEAYLRKVIDATIAQACDVGGPVSAAKLAALFTALRTWEDTSAASYLAGRPLTRHMKTELAHRIGSDERLVPMPPEDFASFARALDGTTHTHRFLPLPGELVDYDYRRAETRIAALFPPTGELARAAFDKRVIDGKTVVFVDPKALPATRRGTPRIATFGLRDTLFVPRSFLKAGDTASLQRRIIHTYAAGFAQLRPATVARASGEASSTIERMLLATNATGPMIEESDYFDRKQRPWVTPYGDVVRGHARKRFSAHEDALRGFWPAYRDYTLRHHMLHLQDSNEHMPLATLSSRIAHAFYESFYDVKTPEDAAGAFAMHGATCRERFSDRIADVGLVVPGFDGPVSVDVDALWRELEHRTGDVHTIDWNNIGDSAWPYFSAIVDDLVRECPHLFRVDDPAPVIAHHFETLFERHQLPADAYVRLGSDVLWPLPARATAEDVATIFATLVAGLRDEKRRVDLDSRRDAKKSLPAAADIPRVGELDAMPLTLLHITGPYAESLSPTRLNGLAPLVNAQLGLQKTIERLDVLRNGAGSLALLHAVASDARSTDALLVHVGRIEQALLHLSVKQVELADGDIPGGYDRGRIFAIQPPVADPTSIRELLTTWPGSKLAKLVDLQRDHAAMVLDPQLRTSMLLNSRFPSYRLDATFTPWAALARLRDAGVHADHLLLLVDVCRNPSELLYAANVLEKLDGGLDASPQSLSVVKSFVERLLQQRLDPHRLRAHAVELATNIEIHRYPHKTLREDEALRDFAAELAAQVEGVSRIPSRDKLLPFALATSLKNAPAFSLSQLIAAQAANPALADALTRGDLMAAVKCARDADAGLTISKLTNNAEHGSERSPTQAALVETVQNSFDAVRTVQAKPDAPHRAHGVDVSVDIINAASDSASLALTVRDSAGMPSLSTLLTDFILPDYSTKADTPGAVGVMGNGLFQLYADAAEVAMVTRLTSDTTKAYALLATPRRENGRIVDLELRCADVSNHMARGTEYGSSLYVRMMPQQREAALYDAIHAQHFTRETLGAASVRGADGTTIPLRLNESTADLTATTFTPLAMRAAKSASAVTSNTRVNLTADEALVSAALPGGKAVRILAREPATRVSQLTTAGVPVMDLARFCRQELLLPDNFVQFIDVGLVLDLPLGSYTPVQSRTDLKLPEATRVALRSALLDAVWLSVFAKHDTDLAHIFQHFGSDTQFLQQVSITARDIREDVDAAIEARRPMNLVSFMTHHEGVVSQSFSKLVASLLTHTTEVDGALGALTSAYWKSAEALGPRIHAYTIERDVASHIEHARTVTISAQKNAKASMKSALADMDPLTQKLAEKAALPWLDKKLDNAVGRLLRLYDDQVGSIRTAYIMAGPRGASTLSPEELEAQRAAYAKKLGFVQERLSGYAHALAGAHSKAAPPTIAFDAPPFAEGIFAQSENHIGLNPQTYAVSRLASDLEKLAVAGTIAPNSTLAKLILASPASSGTLNHEIHHWRQRDGDAHAPGLTPDGDLVDFESCATAHFRAFVAEGGLLAWIERGLA